MQAQYIAVNGSPLQPIDVMASQFRRLRSRLCFFHYLSVIVPQGYLQVACNSSMGRVWPTGRGRIFAINRRLGCRIASKQLWPSACSLLSQHVANKKKLCSLKSQLWLSNQQLSTKIPSERAFGPVPNHWQTLKSISFTFFTQLLLRPNSSTVKTSLMGGKPSKACGCSKRSGIRYLAEIANKRYIPKNSIQCSYFSIVWSNILRRFSWLYIRNPFVPSASLPFLAPVRSPNRCQLHPNRFLTNMVMQPDAVVQTGRLQISARITQTRETRVIRPAALMAMSWDQHKHPAHRHTVNGKMVMDRAGIITQRGLRASLKATKTLAKWRGSLSCPSATMPKNISSRLIADISERAVIC